MNHQDNSHDYLSPYCFLRIANNIFKQIEENVMKNVKNFEKLYQSLLNLKSKLFTDYLQYQIEKFKDYNANLQHNIQANDTVKKLLNIIQTKFEILEGGRIIKDVKFGRYIYSLANASDQRAVEVLTNTSQEQINTLIEREIKKEPWNIQQEISWQEFKDMDISEHKTKFDKLINTQYPVNENAINEQLEQIKAFNQLFNELKIMLKSFQNLNSYFDKDTFGQFVERSTNLVEQVNDYYQKQRQLLSNAVIFRGMFKCMHTLSYYTKFDEQVKDIILSKELNMKYYFEIIRDIHQKNIESNSRDQAIVNQIYNAVLEIGHQIESRLSQIKAQSFAIDISMSQKYKTISTNNATFSNCTGGSISTPQRYIECNRDYDNKDQIKICENILEKFQDQLDKVKKLQADNQKELNVQTKIYDKLAEEKNKIESMKDLSYLTYVQRKFEGMYKITLFSHFIRFITAITSKTDPEKIKKIIVLDLDQTLKCIQYEAKIPFQCLSNWALDSIYSQLNQGNQDQEGKNTKKTKSLLNQLFISYGRLYETLVEKFKQPQELASKPLNSQQIAKILSKNMIQEHIVFLNQGQFEIKKIKEKQIKKLITQLRMTQLCIDQHNPFLQAEKLFKQEIIQINGGKIKPIIDRIIDTQNWQDNEKQQVQELLPYDLSPGSNFHLLINSLKCLN